MRAGLLLLAVLLAQPAFPEDGYTFHIRITDTVTGLREINPEMSLDADRLEQAKKDKVFLMNGTNGTHWRALMLSPVVNGEFIEIGINSSGGGGRLDIQPADLGLRQTAESTVRIRCLQQLCCLRVQSSDGIVARAVLKENESREFPLDSDIDVTFLREPAQ